MTAPAGPSTDVVALRTIERYAALYFGGHAALGAGWWVAVLTSHRFRGLFELDPRHGAVLNAMVVPDMVLLTVVSFAAAIALARRFPSATTLVGVVTGASAYLTLYIAAWVIQGGHGWLGAVALTCETAVMALFAIGLTRRAI